MFDSKIELDNLIRSLSTPPPQKDSTEKKGKKVGGAVKEIFKKSEKPTKKRKIRAKRVKKKGDKKVKKYEKKVSKKSKKKPKILKREIKSSKGEKTVSSDSSGDKKVMRVSYSPIRKKKFTDQDLQGKLDMMKQVPKTPEERKIRREECEIIRAILFEDSGHDPAYILEKIFEHSYGLIMVGVLVELDDASYSERKEKVLSLMKKMYDESNNFLKEYCDQIEYKLDRFIGYIQESKSGCFVRKNALKGMVTSSRANLLKSPLFLENEIISISKISSSKRLKTKDMAFIPRSISENGKGIVQQCAMKSCGQTCVAMLLLDHGLTPDLGGISTGSWSNPDSMIKLLAEGGLKAECDKISTKSKNKFLLNLQKQVHGRGSTIVTLKSLGEGRIGGHVLICDDVSFNLLSVRLRDPWHGWEITVTAEAFLDCVTDEKKESYCTQMIWVPESKKLSK